MLSGSHREIVIKPLTLTREGTMEDDLKPRVSRRERGFVFINVQLGRNRSLNSIIDLIVSGAREEPKAALTLIKESMKPHTKVAVISAAKWASLLSAGFYSWFYCGLPRKWHWGIFIPHTKR
jgi:hypothetical protein